MIRADPRRPGLPSHSRGGHMTEQQLQQDATTTATPCVAQQGRTRLPPGPAAARSWGRRRSALATRSLSSASPVQKAAVLPTPGHVQASKLGPSRPPPAPRRSTGRRRTPPSLPTSPGVADHVLLHRARRQDRSRPRRQERRRIVLSHLQPGRPGSGPAPPAHAVHKLPSRVHVPHPSGSATNRALRHLPVQADAAPVLGDEAFGPFGVGFLRRDNRPSGGWTGALRPRGSARVEHYTRLTAGVQEVDQVLALV